MLIFRFSDGLFPLPFLREPSEPPPIETWPSKLGNPPPTAWTIAGSDSGGGAGIQVDLKVMNAFGVHGCSVITSITAQNSLGVQSMEAVSASMVRAQLDALKEDLPPAAIKIGMLGSAATCRILAGFMESPLTSRAAIFICDPILKSTSGAELLDPKALDILTHEIFPHVGILTPNLPEVEKITGRALQTMEAAAESILEMGVSSVLIKGGHAEGAECHDFWTDGTQSLWLSSPRIETTATHGTGCILSSAITAALAHGQDIPEAITTAKTFMNQCLKAPSNLGKGRGPMLIEPFRNDPQDRPVGVGGVGDPAYRVVRPAMAAPTTGASST